MKKYTVDSLEKTQKIAADFANSLKGGDVVGLIGNLGSGKTTFVQFVGKNLGVRENINSPTFVLLKKYATNKDFEIVHVDLYRAEKYEDIYSAGIEEYLGKPNYVCLIEWADKIPEILEELNKKILFKYINPKTRTIEGDL